MRRLIIVLQLVFLAKGTQLSSSDAYFISVINNFFTGDCPEGWTNRNGFCYLFKQKDTWPNAQKFCEENGANVASIRSKSEESFISNLVYVRNW